MNRVLMVFLTVALCILCGCSGKTNVKTDSERNFSISIKDMQIVYPITTDGSFLFADDLCLFHSFSFTNEYLVEYYSKSLSDDSEPVKQGICLPGEGFVTDCYKDGIHILREVNEVFFLSTYDIKGNMIKEIEIADSGLDRYPNSLGVYDDGSVLILNTDALMLYNADGVLMNIIQSEKYSFKSVVECEGNDTAYIFADSKGEKSFKIFYSSLTAQKSILQRSSCHRL